MDAVERFYGEYYFRARVVWRVIRKAIFNSPERRGLAKEAREYLSSRSARKRFVDDRRKAVTVSAPTHWYPVLSQTSLPVDSRTLEQVFGTAHPLDIDDVWKHSFSASTSKRSGRPSMWRVIRTWWVSRFRTSSADTMRQPIN